MGGIARSMQLGEVIRFGNGKAIKPGGEGCYPVYGSNGIIGGSDEFRYENGVIIGRVGAYCPKKFWASDNTLVAFPASDKVDTKFLFYLLTDAKLSRYAGGAAQPLVTQTVLKQVEVRVPSLPVQRRIAGILSTYDDLIENNQRRIKILEEIARSLYHEWFVNFRFPGYEKVPLVDSQVGDIPQGWEAVPFEKLLFSMIGGDWGSDRPTEDETTEVCVVRGTDFDEVANGGHLRAPVRFIKPPSLKSRGLRPGDVIVENSINAKSRCIGTTLLVDAKVLARIGRDAVAASFCKVFRLHDLQLAPIVHLHFRRLREDGRMEYYQNVAANGIGNFQAQKFTKEEHLIVPKDGFFRSKLIEPIATIFESISILASQLSNLRRTRDLLLPHLLSGQIQLTIEASDATNP